ncbi:threonylcarbamoyl-AMP synthase [Patescibacteria group bacterium]|nr:threonylcarbamoyl-AMP synthase [Patescibacteria group bacterium]
MHTEILKIEEGSSAQALDKAALVIKAGGLVVFPTETVYGLGANALDSMAVACIFVAKGRPSDNPLIVHVADKEMLSLVAEKINQLEKNLIDKFWPGPLTLVLPKKKEISNIVSGGLNTVAVRMPDFKIAQDLIHKSGVPIAAPSANISGRPSSTNGEMAYGDLISKVDIILDNGDSKIGVESTVIKVTDKNILILRPGAVTKEMLEEVAGVPVIFANSAGDLESSPGTKYKHYAPNSKLEIVDGDIKDRAEVLKSEGQKVGIITTKENKNLFEKFEPNVFSLGSRNNLNEISHSVYSALRFFDTHIVDVILCESFPQEGLGVAIMDRLMRASL